MQARAALAGTIIFAPSRTSRMIVERLSTEMLKALRMATVQDKLLQVGVEPMPMNAEEFAAFIKDDLVFNAELAKAAGIAAK